MLDIYIVPNLTQCQCPTGTTRILGDAAYDRMFGAIGLAVHSGLGLRYTHPGVWIHQPFRGHGPLVAP